jgi:hypothetical protein
MRQASQPTTSTYPAALMDRDGRHSFEIAEAKKTISGNFFHILKNISLSFAHWISL